MKEMIKKNWLLVLVVAQPILDIIAYFQYDNLFGSMAGYIRLLIMFVIPLAVLLLKRKLSFVILMGVIGLYCLLHVASCYISGYANLFSDVSYLLRVIQMPILAISFCYLFDKESYKEQIVKGFVINYIMIVISIILAFITKTGDYTYRDYKIGYTGWFANANSQSIILISMAPFIIYYAIKKKNKLGIALAMLAVPIVLLANGTTAGYLAIFVIFGGFFAFYVVDFFMKKGEKKRIQPAMIIGALVIMIFSGVVYPLTPKYAMDTYDTGKREEENEKLNQKKDGIGHEQNLTLEEILADPEAKQMLIDTYKDELNPNLVEKFGVERVLEEYGWWPDSYTLADVRLQKRINAKLIWEDSTMLTKFFGIEFTEMEDYDLENDYPAIYYYYGYVGFGLYIIFLAYFLILIVKTLIKNFKGAFFFFNFILAVTYVLQLGLAQFSGAILRRPNASIYMSLIIALIFYQCRKIENQSKDKVKKVGKMGRIQCFLKKIINREIIMYLVFGVLTTVVNYGVFIIGINISGTEKTLLVNLYAFIAATLFAFITNRLFVFQKQLVRVKIIIEEMIQFFAARIFSLGIEQLGLLLAIEYLDAEKIAVCGISTVYIWKIVLSFLAVLLNYFASKYIVFRKRDEG